MTSLRVVDSLNLPGSPDRPDEDRWGIAPDCAFVIDGATGLGGNFIVRDDDSDAAWLAAFAKVHFEEMIRPGRAVVDIVRTTCVLARRIAQFAADGGEIEPWRLPVAGFQMLRIEDDGALVTHGLGDCVLFITGADGRTQSLSPFGENASIAARAAERGASAEAIARMGGFSANRRLVDDADMRTAQRAWRGNYNKPGGPVWTLGVVPDAADHLVSAVVDAAFPARALLCTDGFAALAELYGRYSPGELIEIGYAHGLEGLGRELRAIEHEEDPAGLKYPRMKVSDDATAVLVELR